MIKITLLLICLFFSLNLVPDKKNAHTLDEYEIICYVGTETYKIENTNNRNYLIFVRPSSIPDYAFYGGDIEISYSKKINNDYFYPIKGNETLYLVIKTYSSLCISYMFSDYNYIHLKNEEEYKHPIVNYETRIETEIENVANKHFIFFINYTTQPYDISLNGKRYRKFSSDEIISMIPEEKNMFVCLKMDIIIDVISIKYVSRPYEYINQDTSKCIVYQEDIKSYFINNATKYFMLTFNDESKYELFKNNKPIESKINQINSLASNDYFFLPKLGSCFELLFLNKSHIEIKNGYSFKILNSKKYNFYINDVEDNIGTIHLIIKSTISYFINSLSINGQSKSLNIQAKNNYYLYNISFTPRKEDNYISIFFDLYSQSYINVEFEVETEKKIEESKTDTTMVVIIVLALVIPFLIGLGGYFCKIYKIKKQLDYKELEKKVQLLEEKNALDKGTDLYSRIKDDYSYINKICVLCQDLDNIVQNNNDSYYYENKNIDIIEDINNGTFENLYDYIYPKKCYHSFHDECCKKKKYDKNKIKDPKNCDFCQLFLTRENLQKFGIFFSEIFMKDVMMKKKNIRHRNIDEIEKIFYSKIEASDNIDNEKKEKLLKIRKLNKKYKNNYENLFMFKKNYYIYYKTNLNEYTDSMMDDLDYAIEKEREKIREKFRRKEAAQKVPLQVCYQCSNICLICNDKMSGFHKKTFSRTIYTIGVHRGCAPDDNLCFMCEERKGRYDCRNYCCDCDKRGKKLSEECYFCHEKFN